MRKFMPLSCPAGQRDKAADSSDKNRAKGHTFSEHVQLPLKDINITILHSPSQVFNTFNDFILVHKQ